MGRACRGKERSDWQRSLQDGGACGNHTGSPLAWHDALAFRGRSPCVTKSAMHRLVLVVLNHTRSPAAQPLTRHLPP